MADRGELIRSALAFLTDPNTRNHPLTQRISFLESKGLTTAEIESVLAQAQATTSSAPVASSSTASTYGSSGYAPGPAPYAPQYLVQQPPPVPQRDWRDYFIMAVVSGGFVFGVVSFARKYLLPHLKPPSATAYEADHDALTAQFDEVAKLIASIESETASQRAALDEQKTKVDSAIDRLQIALAESKDAETRTKADLRDIREEVTNVRDMLPKMLEKNKDAQSQALLDLQQELKSLKALLLSRSGPPLSSSLTSSATGGSALYPPSSHPTSPYSIGALGGQTPPLPKPTIPAWQLASSAGSNTPTLSPAPASTTAPAPAPFQPSTALTGGVEGGKADKGKGKAVDNSVDPLASSGVLVSEAGSESEAESEIEGVIA